MIEFDPKKAAANFKKHGIHFADVEPVFYDDRAFTTPEIVDGEERYLTIGLDASQNLVAVAWTERGENERLISARPAEKKERKDYEQ